jgi:hypothetical protein
MTWSTIVSVALAGEAHVVLQDLGRARSAHGDQGRVALLVSTPCVAPEALIPWGEALEEAGLDAWILSFEARNQTSEELVVGLQESLQWFGDRELVIAAHGYAGVLVLLADTPARRLALVGTPLAAQVVPPLLLEPGAVVSEGLPFAPELLGPLPTAPCSGQVAQDYARWATAFPDYAVPQQPVLVVASNIDPVAPPESVRLPSLDWPQRSWHRAGMLGVGLVDPSHGTLLTDERIEAMVVRFLVEP